MQKSNVKKDMRGMHISNALDKGNDKIIDETGTILGVKFKKAFYPWSLFYNIKKYYIYDNSKFISTVYLRPSNINQTIPLRPLQKNMYAINRIDYINSISLAHELTHAVNYSYIPFYLIWCLLTSGFIDFLPLSVPEVAQVRKNEDDNKSNHNIIICFCILDQCFMVLTKPVPHPEYCHTRENTGKSIS